MYFNKLRGESDRLCREHELSVIEKPGTVNRNRYQNNELYAVVRSDIDEAIRRTMTLSQFYMVMKRWGYIVNDDPNRKYATIRPPGTQNRIRFKTLGEDYTPKVITRRILQHRPVILPSIRVKVKRYRFKGSLQNVKSIGLLTALFLVFMLILRKIYMINRVENNPHPQRFTPELRAAVRQMERYSEQTRLLCRFKLNNDTDVTSFIDNRKQDISLLERERTKVYNRMKSAKTPKKLDTLKSERDELSKQITVFRKQVKTAQTVLTDWKDVRRKIQAQRELDKHHLEREKQRPQQQIKQRYWDCER